MRGSVSLVLLAGGVGKRMGVRCYAAHWSGVLPRMM